MLQNKDRGQPTTLRHFLFDDTDPECEKEFDRFINVMLVVFILCLIGAICWHAVALGRLVDASAELPHSTYFPAAETPKNDKLAGSAPAKREGDSARPTASYKSVRCSKPDCEN